MQMCLACHALHLRACVCLVLCPAPCEVRPLGNNPTSYCDRHNPYKSRLFNNRRFPPFMFSKGSDRCAISPPLSTPLITFMHFMSQMTRSCCALAKVLRANYVSSIAPCDS